MEDIVSATEVEEEKEKRESESDINIIQYNDKDEEKSGTGIITHFISNLVSPKSPKAVVFGSKNGEACCDGDLGQSGRGVVNNLFTNLFHNNSKEDEEESVEKKKEEENGNGGIIDNIVSHFPTSIPDDAVPTTDEASLLIYAIVKD